jgi:hypothetical protein
MKIQENANNLPDAAFGSIAGIYTGYVLEAGRYGCL